MDITTTDLGTPVGGGIGTSAAAGMGLNFGGGVPPGVSPGITTTTAAGQDFVSGAAGGGFLSNALGYLSNNPALLLGAGALGADLLLGNQPLPAEAQVQNASAEQASVGNTLSAFGLSGTLPSGLQDAINMNTNAGIAAVRSQYGQLGLTGSTMESQAIQQIKEAATAQQATLANQLLSQGAQWTGMSNQELNTLLQTQMAQDAALTQAIGTFAGGIAGSSLRPVTPTPAA